MTAAGPFPAAVCVFGGAKCRVPSAECQVKEREGSHEWHEWARMRNDETIAVGLEDSAHPTKYGPPYEMGMSTGWWGSTAEPRTGDGVGLAIGAIVNSAQQGPLG